jgi:hypothetical protein
MILEYKAKVESNTFIGSILNTTIENISYSLIPNKDGSLEEIIIRKKYLNLMEQFQKLPKVLLLELNSI